MQFVLVLPLMFSIISHQQSLAVETKAADPTLCSPGYFLNITGANPKCDRCENGTFTAIENRSPKCLPCSFCNNYQTVKQKCWFDRDVECDCKQGFYYSHKYDDCEKCSCENCIHDYNNHEFIQKCQPCKRKECQKKPECRKMCPTVTTLTSASPTTSTTTRKPPPTRPSNRTPNPAVTKITPQPEDQAGWASLVVVGVLFLLLFWLMLLYTRNLFRHSERCWSGSKDLEDVEINERQHHRVPTTLTWEETPMMPVSEIPPKPDSGSGPVGPRPAGSVLPVSKQEKLSDRWPAVVLYAIIQEVPLRRWKEFMRRLSVADQQLERVELEAGLALDSMERQYQMLKLWSQRSTASLSDVFSTLRHMELSGCAQLLQEHLDRLPWKPDAKQSHSGLNGTMHT